MSRFENQPYWSSSGVSVGGFGILMLADKHDLHPMASADLPSPSISLRTYSPPHLRYLTSDVQKGIEVRLVLHHDGNVSVAVKPFRQGGATLERQIECLSHELPKIDTHCEQTLCMAQVQEDGNERHRSGGQVPAVDRSCRSLGGGGPQRRREWGQGSSLASDGPRRARCPCCRKCNPSGIRDGCGKAGHGKTGCVEPDNERLKRLIRQD
jgi:hypothetical protein